MQTRQLGTHGPRVSALGLGCMGMTPIYATPDPDEAIATIRAAVDSGITMIDTADMYGGGKNEELVGRAIGGIRDRVVLASKFGNMRLPDGSRMVNAVGEIAASKGVSTAAIAIAWVLARGNDVVPIPGCSRRATLADSLKALDVQLSDDELAGIEAALDADRIIGTRYPEKQMQRLGI